MTRPLHHPLNERLRREMARLLQLHVETHPDRIARRFGVTPRYVRQLWARYPMSEMASLSDALHGFQEAGGFDGQA